MNRLFKELYDRFYTPPELPAQKQETEEFHPPIEMLEKTKPAGVTNRRCQRPLCGGHINR